MTTEDKARAYDEALKNAEIAYNDEDKDFKSILEIIFPVLKESESEKMRKWIIAYLDNRAINTCVPEEKESLRNAISWLEQQKERTFLSRDEEYTLSRIIEYLEDNNCPDEWKSLLLDIHNLPYYQTQQIKLNTVDPDNRLNYTKDHHTAMILSIECMNEHGWFERERQMMELKDYIEKICGYDSD